MCSTLKETEKDVYAETGYFVKINLQKRDKIKQKTLIFPFLPQNAKTNIDEFTEYMFSILSKN